MPGELYPNGERPVTLMDMGTVVAKLRKKAEHTNLDQSEEINACSVKIKVDVDGAEEDYPPVQTKPTTTPPKWSPWRCFHLLGGAIRDPLSGRGYVYQAMRLSAAAIPAPPWPIPCPASYPSAS